MTKLWRQATTPKEFTDAYFEDIDAHVEDIEKLEGVALNLPQSLGKSFPKLTVHISTKQKPNDYFEVGLLLVVSDRLRSVLETFEVNALYHPVNVSYRAKRYVDQRFYFAHLMDQVDCLDWKKSKYELDQSGNARPLKKLILDERKAAGFSLFMLARVRGVGPIRLCSDELAQHVEAEKRITGVRFDKPENFRGMAPR